MNQISDLAAADKIVFLKIRFLIFLFLIYNEYIQNRPINNTWKSDKEIESHGMVPVSMSQKKDQTISEKAYNH